MKNQLRKLVLLAVLILQTTSHISAYDFCGQRNYYNVASLSDFAAEKADNNYAKESKNIMLIAYGLSDKIGGKEITVNIIDFMTNKWIISIVSDDGVILSGVFTLKSADKSNSSLDFTGQGINNQTGEEIRFMITSDNTEICLSFSNLKENKSVDVNMPCRVIVSEDIPNTKILFNNLRWPYNLSDSGWKIGTPKQLKKCLSQNPYLRKQ
ncbi:MAG: hypothetical protein K2M96_00860 [Prevotella sp.]|nr:hypothetical protein [Prevotella sp.]